MKVMFTVYLILIHVLLGTTLLKSDFIERVKTKLGYSQLADEITPHFKSMLSIHKSAEPDTPDNPILFIGDSHVQGLAVNDLFPNSVNLGIGGDTTVGVLTRLPEYASATKSKMIVLAIGVNDLRRRPNTEIIENYNKIIAQIPTAIPILVNAIIPVDEIKERWIGYNDRIVEINQQLEKLCSTDSRLYCVDPSPALVDPEGNLADQFHIGDGIHLSALGDKVWMSELSKAAKTITPANTQ